MGVKISELTEAMAAQNTDEMPIVQNGETKKINVETLMSNLQTQMTNLQNQVNDKNVITAKMLNDYTIQATSTVEDVKSFSLYNSVGSKLTIDNGCIKIGAGVSKVKVSYHATTQNSTSDATTRTFTYLTQNTISVTQESHYFNRTGEQISVSHNSIIRSVNEGDIFYLRIYGLAGGKLMGGSSFCHTEITVEVID